MVVECPIIGCHKIAEKSTLLQTSVQLYHSIRNRSHRSVHKIKPISLELVSSALEQIRFLLNNDVKYIISKWKIEKLVRDQVIVIKRIRTAVFSCLRGRVPYNAILNYIFKKKKKEPVVFWSY